MTNDAVAPGPVASERAARGRGWSVELALSGAVSDFLDREVPATGRRAVWEFRVERDVLIFGSTQHPSVGAPRAARAGVTDRPALEVVRRRTGGAAVLLDAPHVWIDVIVPRGDPLWDDDVHRSFAWLGATWARALATFGLDGDVHAGPVQRTPWTGLVCFAGVGAGEVTVEGRKVVGLAQRRTRHGSRFQCLAYTGSATFATSIVDVLGGPDVIDRPEALRAHLRDHVLAIPVDRSQVVDAFLAALP